MAGKAATLVVKILTDASKAAQGVDSASSKVTSFAKNALKAGAAVVGALAADALWAGFKRLNQIDEAESKLRGLGYSAKQVEKIMTNANAAVKGTAFGLGEAATAAAGAVAAGVKPGKDLERTLTLIGDAATIAGTDFASMGAIFNKVAASNKIQGDVIAQLQDQGIPIVKLLGEELGVTASKVIDLASKGKINFAQFQAAMQSGLGGAAQESGKTFTGALKNVQAALGRLGASVLQGVFSQMPATLGSINAGIDKLGPTAERVGAMFGDAFGDAMTKLAQLGPVITRFAKSDLFGGLVDGVLELGTTVGSVVATIAPALEKLFGGLASGFIAGAVSAISALVSGLNMLAPVVTTVADGFASLVQWIPVEAMQAFASVLGVAAVAIGAIRVATAAWAAVQAVLNAALTANPLGLLVVAIGAAVAAIVVLWKKNKGFRDFVKGAWAAIASAAKTAWNAIKAAITTVIAWAKPYIAAFVAVIKPLWRGISAAAKVAWTVIKTVVSTVLKWAKAYIRGYLTVVKFVFKAIRVVARIAWHAVKTVISTVLKWAKAYIRGYAAVVKIVFKAIKTTAATAWRGIRTVISTVVRWAKSAIRGLKTAVNQVWRDIKSVASTAWRAIRDVIQSVVDKVGKLVTAVKTNATKAFNTVKTAAVAAFEAIKVPIDAVKKSIDKVISAVRSVISWLGRIKIPKGLSSIIDKVTALPPAPAAPAAAPAPALYGYGAPAAAAGGTYAPVIINITGTLHDADAARAVRRVLRNDQRRRGGVRIDRVRTQALG